MERMMTHKANPTPPPDMDDGAVVVNLVLCDASVGMLGAGESAKATSNGSILIDWRRDQKAIGEVLKDKVIEVTPGAPFSSSISSPKLETFSVVAVAAVRNE